MPTIQPNTIARYYTCFISSTHRVHSNKECRKKCCHFFWLELFFFFLSSSAMSKAIRILFLFSAAGVIFIFLWMLFAHTNSRFNALYCLVWDRFFFSAPLHQHLRLHWVYLVAWIKTITMYIVIGFCQWQKSRPQNKKASKATKTTTITTTTTTTKNRSIHCVRRKNKTTSKITEPK